MDPTAITNRAKAILTTPKTEWPVIAAEGTSVKELYVGYIMVLAAIPPIFRFIKASLIGYGGFGFHFRIGIGAGIGSMVVSWLLALAGIYVVALIINALAKSFGGQPDPIQALKVLAYAYTAAWLAGVGAIIPWLGWLLTLAGAIYSIYLLYLGLPDTMHCPRDKATGYVAVTVICSIIVYVIIGAIAGSITGYGFGHGFNAAAFNHGSDTASVTFDKHSTLGSLQAAAQSMQTVGKEMASGNGGPTPDSSATVIHAVSIDQLTQFVPATLDGLPRTGLSSSSNAMGMQIAAVDADYGQPDGKHIHLSITDLGSASGMLALGRLAGNSEQQTPTGFSKTYQQDGNTIQEHWDNTQSQGDYATTVAGRFSVKLSGKVGSIDELEHATQSLDLKGLAALKNVGVQK